MKKTKKNSRNTETFVKWGLGAIMLFFVVLTWFVCDHSFFWDTIQLSSLQAHWFYENGFDQFLLPKEIDSGHPPAFGWYLALMWKVFGKSLVVSHFAMLPFLLGTVYGLYRLGKCFFNGLWVLVAPLLMILDPVYLGQSVLVSPDIALLFFFLMVLLGVFEKRNWAIMLGGVGLALISMRGMMVLASLFFFSWVLTFLQERKVPNISLTFRKLLPFLLGAFAGFGFLIFHYLETGWIGYHADSPWALSFEGVDGKGFVRNLVVLVWRFLDFGRVVFCVLFLVLGWCLFKERGGVGGVGSPSNAYDGGKPSDAVQQSDAAWQSEEARSSDRTWELLLLVLVLFLFLTPSLLLHEGLVAHRYLLPVFLIFDLLGLYLLWRSSFSESVKRLMLGLVTVAFLTGHFWVYPPKISQGWDSSLAHLPYYDLRQMMIEYMKSEQISFDQVGSAFPNLRSFKHIDLNESEERFSPKDLSQQAYIFYSNVFNDFSDEEIDELFMEWEVKKEFKKRGVMVILFQRAE